MAEIKPWDPFPLTRDAMTQPDYQVSLADVLITDGWRKPVLEECPICFAPATHCTHVQREKPC